LNFLETLGSLPPISACEHLLSRLRLCYNKREQESDAFFSPLTSGLCRFAAQNALNIS
jgi:hypothetical protein